MSLLVGEHNAIRVCKPWAVKGLTLLRYGKIVAIKY